MTFFGPLLRSLPACLLLAATAHAQTRIVDPAALVADVSQQHRADAAEQLMAMGVDSAATMALLSPSATDTWPPGLRTDSARTANRAAVANYAVELLGQLPTVLGDLAVVRLAAMANLHMPEDRRERRDLYLLVHSEGLEVSTATASRPKPSPGPKWSKLPQARIVKPDALYATYDLSTDPEALHVLERKGLSQAEIEAVVFRSHQRNWPDAIDDFGKRLPRQKDLTRYKAYKAAQWDDKVLLVVPASDNRHLPDGLRPPLDIYMVYAAPAVSVKSR